MTHSTIRRGIIVLLVVLLGACGGGGGAPLPMPPSNLLYPSAPAFVVQQPITELTPTVTGTVTSYGVSPALPKGLSLNSSSGVLSGTPTALTAKATYTVTAKNAGGSTTASLALVVNDVAPSISYLSPYYAFTAAVAAQTITPMHSGGAIVTWSVSPALPAGLVFSTTNGSISGTPTAAAAPATYVMNAGNSGGQSPVSLTIAVAAAPLLDLGHANGVILIRTTASDVLSLDVDGHWLLQNIVSGATLASGDGACASGMCPQNQNGSFTHLPVDLAASTLIDVAPGGLEIRSASDGHVLATIPGQYSWYQLAADGSYVCAGSPTALTAWTTSGQMMISHPGDYAGAIPFSAPGQIRVARGPAGQSVIEAISTTTGASSLSAAYQGTFNSWFSDGGRFLTALGTTVWTYSSAGAPQDITQVSATDHLAGEGNWFWTFDTTNLLNVYQVGASASPALSGRFGDIEAHIVPSGTTLGIPSGTVGQVTVINLSGSVPVSAAYTVPIPYLYTYGATSSTAWFTANEYGVVLDGASLSSQPRYLTRGAAWSIAGGAGYFSVATASGEIFNYDAATDALVSTIPFASSQLSLSSSGTVLAALANTNYAQYAVDRTVNIYALPSGNVTNSFPYSYNTSPFPASMSLSGSGSVLAVNFVGSLPSCNSQVFPVGGGPAIWCGIDQSFLEPQLSPDGTLIASPTPGGSTQSTNIYKNGTLATAVPGSEVGWLDSGRLLALTFDAHNNYLGSAIYDPLGNLLANSPIPDIYAFNVATPNSIYSPLLNQILSLTSGTPTWVSANASIRMGAISSSQVIFASGSLVLAQPY